jgi:C4-dicarboxylate transporter, DctM subunit
MQSKREHESPASKNLSRIQGGDVMTIWLPFIILFVSMLYGVPVAYAMALAGVAGLLMSIGLDPTMGILASLPFSETASYTLSTVPMFILMAELLSQGRITSALFSMASKWLSSLRGGLAMAVVGANGIFGAMSGSSVAAAGLLASVSVPEMRKAGYSERISLGTVASAGTFSVMIPPSIALIIYGVATGTSIGRLFAAGLLPGIGTALTYLVVVYGWARLRPQDAPSSAKVVWKEKLRSLTSVLPAIPLIILVLGGIYAGVMTPTEAGAVGAFGALIISITLGGLRWSGIRDAVRNTTTITSMIILIIIGAGLFNRFLSTSGATSIVLEFITELAIPEWATLALLLVVYVILGTFMSQAAILLLTLPLTFPVAIALGYDPIWFGIVVVKTVEIGLATPPLGLNVYVTHGVAGGKLEDTFIGSAVFLLGDVLILAAILFFPTIVIEAGNFIFAD